MKRVLIVEDEFLVRIGLKTTIDWNQYGYTIVGEASNGKEALDMFDELNPDILITDVKMPIMDGLQLISETKKHKPDLQVVILSNYDDFEYARKALTLGANEYLLKSEVNEEGLIKVLGSLAVADAQEAALSESTLHIRQEHFLKKFIPSLYKTNFISLETEELDGIFPRPYYQVLSCDGDFSYCGDIEIDAMVKSMESIFKTIFEESSCSINIVNNHLRIILVYPVDFKGEGNNEKTKSRCSLLVRNVKNYMDIDIHTGASSTGTGGQMLELLNQAEDARLNCFFTNQSIDLFTNNSTQSESEIPHISARALNRMMEEKEREKLEEYIVNIFNQLLEGRNFNHLQNGYIDLVSTAKSICEVKGVEMAGGLSSDKFVYDNLLAFSCMENARNFVLDLYRAIISSLEGNQDSYSHNIRQCLGYIENHFAENISLDDLANQVCISKSYLSMLFKQEMGINFINYLTEYRLEKAKKLLTRSNMKIYEIAEQVGFSSPYYFSKVFKDANQVSCKEFKDKFSGRMLG